eukprot:TRINITY_DN15401_c0_g1_i4.p1 TRINITY_DN15401_c0_g1~~TRINITY_DN15401_c0_g1_i4.p1  ORF type:complete len:346 (+),score=39.13 TRINITY_DN15401_c0_g1_i4:64-1038(+)
MNYEEDMRESNGLRNRLRTLREMEDTHGQESAEVDEEKVRTAEVCCTLALEKVCRDQEMGTNPRTEHSVMTHVGEVYEPLTKAKGLLDAALVLLRPGTVTSSPKVLKGRAVAYSNLACLYKRVSRTRAGLICSQKASQIYRQLQPDESEALISSLLSESALLCSCDKPKEGLKVANEALRRCVDLEKDSEKLEVRYASLQAMCHHNVGVCCEILGNVQQALTYYRTAFQLTYLSAGPEHPLCDRFKECFADAYAQSHGKQTRQSLRAFGRSRGSAVPPLSILLPGSDIPKPKMNTKMAKRYNLDNRLPAGRSNSLRRPFSPQTL